MTPTRAPGLAGRLDTTAAALATVQADLATSRTRADTAEHAHGDAQARAEQLAGELRETREQHLVIEEGVAHGARRPAVTGYRAGVSW